MTTKQHIDELIILSFLEELDDEGRAQLAAWREQSASNERYYQELQRTWTDNLQAPQFSRPDRAFEQFQQKTAFVKEKKVGIVRRLWRYAAVAIILVGVALTAYKGGQQQLKSEFASITMEAPHGSNIKTTLPDGTDVWLNAGSRISYSQGFGVDDRRVAISGEGYFEVKRNEQLPFVVSSENIQVTVLGTKFNFSDYADDDYAVVALTEGRVRMQSVREQEDCIISPDQRVIYDKRTGSMTTEQCTAADARLWTDNSLVLDGETFEQAVRKMERAFRVSITITNDSIRHLHFHGRFNANEQTIDEVLSDLSLTGKFRYKTSGKSITIY